MKRYVLFLAVGVSIIFFPGCKVAGSGGNSGGGGDDEGGREAEKAPVEISEDDFLVLQHLETDHISSVEEVRAVLTNVLNSSLPIFDENSESANIQITGVETYTATLEYGFRDEISDTSQDGEAAATTSELPFYIWTLENSADQTEGYAISCADKRIGSILAIVEEGAYDDSADTFMEVFYMNLAGYIGDTIDKYNSVTAEEIAEVGEKVRLTGSSTVLSSRTIELTSPLPGPAAGTDFAPLLNDTKWNQAKPYNDVVNFARGTYKTDTLNVSAPPFVFVYTKAASDNHYTGCVSLAMAQIMAYHEWPEKCTLSGTFMDPYDVDSEGYNLLHPTGKTMNTPGHTMPAMAPARIDLSQINYDWKLMKTKPMIISKPAELSLDKFNEAKIEIGALIYEAGKRVNTTYGPSGSSAKSELVPAALGAMGYNVPQGLQSYDYYLVKSSINQRSPLYISGAAIKTVTKTTTYQPWDMFHWFPYTYTYTEYKDAHAWVIDDYRTITRQETVSGVTFAAGNYVHCNPGWGGSMNGWYKSGVFDMHGTVKDVSMSINENTDIGKSAKTTTGEAYNFQFEIKVIPYITPKRG